MDLTKQRSKRRCPLLADTVEKLRRHYPNRKSVGCGRNPLLDIGLNSNSYFPVAGYENQISNRAWSIETSETSKIVLQQVRGQRGHRSRMDWLSPSGPFSIFLVFPGPISIMPSASTGTHAGGYLEGEGPLGEVDPYRSARQALGVVRGSVRRRDANSYCLLLETACPQLVPMWYLRLNSSLNEI